MKRANSLLDHDLAFMNTSVLQDQDELPPGKWDGSDNINELDMDVVQQEEDQRMAPFQDT